jgi:hypothetical protein
VENIQTILFRKLGARNRRDALTIADSWGLIEPGHALAYRNGTAKARWQRAAVTVHAERDAM